ncbi:MAG: hypothetical protein ABIH00_05925 [Armatimonadota bacterium]
MKKNQKGIALVVGLLILLILIVIAVSVGSIGIFNLRTVSGYRDTVIAGYAAKAGIANAMDSLNSNPAWTTGFNNAALSEVSATYTITFGTGAYDSTNNLLGSAAVTRADGVVVPAGCAYVIGTGKCGGRINRIGAMIKTDISSLTPPWNYALFGYNSISIGGTSDVVGDIGTNTTSLTVDGSSTVTGETKTNAGEAKPLVEDPLASSPSGENISTTCTLSPGKYGSISLSGGGSEGDTVTLTAGTYSFTSIDLQSKGKIAIASGPVYIYVNGNLKLTGLSVSNTSQDATQCIFYGTTGCVAANIQGGSNSFFGVYLPSATVDFRGTSDLHGAAIGFIVTTGGTAQVIYDANLASLLGSSSTGSVEAVTWQNVY